MSRRFLCVIALTLPWFPVLGFGADATEPLRVMSFNIRYDTARDGFNRWALRRHLVVEVMRFHKAEIIGIQEGLGHQVAELKRELEFSSFGQGRDGKTGGERCTIFYDPERVECVRNATFWLSSTPEVPSRSWGSSLRRIVTWGEFRRIGGSRSFFVFNTHFDHRSENARRQSARLLIGKVGEIAGEAPVIVMGDFNAAEGSIPYRIMLEGQRLADNQPAPELALRDARYASRLPDYGPSGTFTGFGQSAIEGTRIDFVLTKNDVQVVQHRVLSDHSDGRTPSDHRPVLADVLIHASPVPRHIVLRHQWRFQTDPKNIGLREAFHRFGFDDSAWGTTKAGEPWELLGLPDYNGIAYYRRWIRLPASWKGRQIHLVSGGIGNSFTLFVNEQEFLSVKREGEGYWNLPTAILLPAGLLEFERENLIVFRVHDHGAWGGFMGAPPRLTIDPVETTHTGVIEVISEPEAEDPPPRRPSKVHEDAIFFAGSWYWFSENVMLYPDAKVLAKRMKGKLVVISSKDENEFVMKHIPGRTFLGLERIQGQWVIQDHRSKGFYHWDQGEPGGHPDELYAVIGFLPGGRWHDVLKHEKYHACVEWGKE